MSTRLPLSVLLLVRDETHDVEELLPQLAFAAEVVVVWDPRGDRATREAAERLGARVFEREFAGFGAQRAFALAQCTQPWVLWLDADERLTPESVPTLERAIATGAGRPLMLLAHRSTWFLGRRIRWCGWRGEWLVRFFAREPARFDDALVHERVHVPGATVLTGLGPFELEHHSYRTWDSCVDKMLRYSRANADQAYRAGRRAGPADVLFRPGLRFLRQYVLQRGFLDGAHGLVLCGFASAQVFLKYARLWWLSERGGVE